MAELQATPWPGIELKGAEQRWASCAGSCDVGLLAGDTLLHTDLAPHNVLISDRAHIIDWAWPTRGASWIDPAVIILRLMEAGHSAEGADTWARAFLASRVSAPTAGVTVFSKVSAAARAEIARNDPQDRKKTWPGTPMTG
ncbi:hypothetical protein [Streptomyces rhizosphaerihabitans]|uniref:hypothetical protein n=1 Tax=Streptomyces rhizosphaerihabitans TaxID=1266770 RepID=UPI0021BF985D|nr:hypothetical protein [Streptomyces rhizosphaerihabitans]MCT9009145.1 hypothetical protein [Streptomyces rhizosphaerihabitans]